MSTVKAELERRLEWDLYAHGSEDGGAPGRKRQAYNAVTRRLYTSEIVGRVDPEGRSLAEFFQNEVAVPLGIGSSVSIGARDAVEGRICHHEAAATFPAVLLRILIHRLVPEVATRLIYGRRGPDNPRRLYSYKVRMVTNLLSSSLARRALKIFTRGPRGAVATANCPRFRALPMASVAGIASARAPAKIGSALSLGGTCVVTGTRLLSSDGLQRALETEEDAPLMDEILCRPATYMACGWSSDRFEFVGCDGWVGWAGAGGSVMVFSPSRRTAVAYVPTRLEARLFKVQGVRLLFSAMRCWVNLWRRSGTLRSDVPA